MAGRLRLLAQALAVVAVGALFALLVWKVVDENKSNAASELAQGNRPPAPAFTLPRLNGPGTLTLSSLRGKGVVVNFWASWCIPCRSEFPLLREVHGGDVTVLGVVFDDSRAAARRFMRDHDANWPGLIDPRGEIAAAYGVGRKPGIPITVAVDPAGVLAGRHIGEARRADLDRLVAQARHR